MADDEKKRRGGGMPGTPTGTTTPPSPKKADAKTPSEPGRVPRNDKSLLDLPLRKLPLGYSTDLDADINRFRLWVPTDTGGTLEIEYGSAAFEEGLESGTVDLRKPFRKIIQKAARKVTYEVKTGEYGEFFVIAAGKAGDYIQCSFTQVSFSRDGTGDVDDPLIPWNFWYWPSADSPSNPDSVSAADVMKRYGKAFGHDPDACSAAEHKDHGTEAITTAPYYDWQGHCHNAAPASALFEKPSDVTYEDQEFSEADMKYLAAEYFGSFGVLHRIWELKRGSSKPGPASGARFYLPAYFKPGDPSKDRAKLIEGLKQEFRGDLPLDDPRLVKAAEQIADAQIADLGGEAAFKKKMDEWMGELAAEFYQMLIDYLRVKKHPLVSNMRSYHGNGGPDQVWNQVYFCYSANYSEHHGDENDMLIEGFLFANLDRRGLTSFPAKIINNRPMFTVGQQPEHLWFAIKWRVIFDGKGKIVIQDARNAWMRLSNDQGDPLYAPTDLLLLDKPTTTRPKGVSKRLLGNKFVGTELVKAGLLKVHKRYQ